MASGHPAVSWGAAGAASVGSAAHAEVFPLAREHSFPTREVLLADVPSNQIHARDGSENGVSGKGGKSRARSAGGAFSTQKFCRKGRQPLEAHE
jgi:hypothetical protein